MYNLTIKDKIAKTKNTIKQISKSKYQLGKLKSGYKNAPILITSALAIKRTIDSVNKIKSSLSNFVFIIKIKQKKTGFAIKPANFDYNFMSSILVFRPFFITISPKEIALTGQT